jgi:RimJ/RimL family protein N-acetyltransferase
MSVKSDVLLGPPELAARAAVDEGWFDDQRDNRLMGHGKGELGHMKAAEHLRDALANNDPSVRLLGIYSGTSPMGLFWIVYKGDNKRTAEIHATLPHKTGRDRVVHGAFVKVMDQLFSNGVYRVEVEPLRINRSMVKLLRHYGFKQEGIKRSAFWMDNNDYDTVLLRMLRREWTRKEN